MPTCSSGLRLWLLCAVLGAGLATGVQAQTVTYFDENDAPGSDYRDASFGAATGGDVLTLAGPGTNKLPIHTENAFQGAVSGLLQFQHSSGSWDLFLARDGWAPADLTQMDSLVFFLNGPERLPAEELPQIGLEDVANRKTPVLPLYEPEGDPSFNADASGFLAGSTTDAVFTVRYIASLPASQRRPGYPANLRITFSEAPLDTSRAGIGVPAIPAFFRVTTEDDGRVLAFRFRDQDGDSTLSAAGDYLEILTPESEGSSSLKATWRVDVTTTAATAPTAGDTYRLVVNDPDEGVDDDPTTWRRFAVPLSAFEAADVDFTQIKTVRFASGDAANPALRTLWVDAVFASRTGSTGGDLAPPENLVQRSGDRSVILHWDDVPEAVGYHVYRSLSPMGLVSRRTATPRTEPHFVDFDVENDQAYYYHVRATNALEEAGSPSDTLVANPRVLDDEAFLDLLQLTGIDYFWYEANPANGLVKDRTRPNSASSIAAVGFGLSALTVGVDRGWLPRDTVRQRVLNTLRFFWNSPQSNAATNVTGYRGFYYHFLDMNTGYRRGTTELSTIDTALLLGGVLDMKIYFDQDHPDEAEIRALSDSLYHRVEWDWAVHNDPLVTLAWRPERGFSDFDWRGYNEAMIIYLLAFASPTHPIDGAAWIFWANNYRWETHYGFSFLVFPPLFGHQYTHVWYDFRGIQDPFMRGKGIDYFENSRRATLAQQAYAVANPGGWQGYTATTWGLTASDIPTGYRARGAPPNQNDDGTITPTAPGGSFPFTPEVSMATLRGLYDTYRTDLWGVYGFKDAINPTVGWVATDFLGIDQGPIVLMIENHRTGRIWNRFMEHPAAKKGLIEAGFTGAPLAAEAAELPQATTLGTPYPNPFREAATVPYTLAAPGRVTLELYDLLGRRLATLADAVQPAGSHTLTLTADVPAGVYFLRLRAGETHATTRVIRL